MRIAKTIWGDKILRAFRRKLVSEDTGLLIPDAKGGKLLLTRVHDFPDDSSGDKVSKLQLVCWLLLNSDL